ncbi:uncharacterized protein LOC112054415 [Bicyclus anynana]|uniref:Uncharacterized protein LOC112054415 n=1 Tax=Bicyclus anynana TaxID=110368 RepID=A0ABM3LSF4_BICAN|nr:uncharacterized protein LOC112054415 [Bicyclus anynana]
MANMDIGIMPRKRAEHEPRLVLQQCCFCCIRLRTGSLILAYLYLIGVTLNLGYAIMGMATVISYLIQMSESFRPVLIKITLLTSVILVLNFVTIPFNVLLLVGLHTERPRYVRTYIIFQIICTILTALQQIITMCIVTQIFSTLVGVLLTLVYIAINVYYLLVLRSHYHKMVEGSDQRSQMFQNSRLTFAPKA